MIYDNNPRLASGALLRQSALLKDTGQFFWKGNAGIAKRQPIY
jgi:hypothetical protein